ncbi:MAG: ATPase, T2SS/T4P/T4SS family [Vicinamibacterales bacterium]
MNVRGFVGDLLIRKGVIDDAALARAVEAQSGRAATLGKTLADLGLCDEPTVARLVAEAMHLEYLEEAPDVGAAVTGLLTPEFCRKRRTFPLALNGNTLRLAVCDPLDLAVQTDVEFRTGKKVVAVVATQTLIERAVEGLYPQARAPAATSYDMLDEVKPAGEVESTIDLDSDTIDVASLVKDTNLPPIVRLVNLILSDAAKAGASDIHIEPHELIVQVRQRVDGLLRETLTIPIHLRDQTISRLKIISGMDIAERRKPQDGRSRLRFEGRRIDLRVSTLPTQFGEKVVVRLLNASTAARPIDQLDLSPWNLRLVRGFLGRSRGLVLVTGPTGSGKTSTLYASLNSIKSSTNNIITLEDPIEFQVPGVNQTQINPRAGVTFASGLRSILRQDPNVILVGEIRDQETAVIALQAAQTGHLLLSTLHTNDAASTITRLFDLGVQPFLVASSLVGVIAQRLVRRVCPACATARPPSEEAVERIGKSRVPRDATWMAGAGCEQCAGTGLKGRLAIHEVLSSGDEIRELISSRSPDLAIRNAARRAGMLTILEDGIAKAARGLTTLEEVLQAASSQDRDPDVAEAPPMVSVPAPVVADTNRRRRVLVVEDNATISSVVKYFLELEGFDVTVAADGRAGLDLALRECPDLIVSDVRMPGMTGTEMVKNLRGNPSTARTRILMLTSEESVESETEALAAGADDYILKPVEPRRLAARVKALLARPGVGAGVTA